MRIQKLDENSRKNLLEDLLKRSPNNYGQYEQGVTEILANVKKGSVSIYCIDEHCTGKGSWS